MAGRKLKYQSEEELQAGIDEFFRECEERDEIPTISGLALHLGISRVTLVNYGNNDQFFNTVARARQKVERTIEQKLFDKNAARGAEFNLKNNFLWKDQQHVDQTTNGESTNELKVVFIDEAEEDENQAT